MLFRSHNDSNHNSNHNSNHQNNIDNTRNDRTFDKNNNGTRIGLGGNISLGMFGPSSLRSNSTDKSKVSSPMKIISPNRSPQTIVRKGGLNILDKDEKGNRKGSLRSYSNHQSPNRSSYITTVDAFIEGNRSVEITGSEQVGWDSIIRRSR